MINGDGGTGFVNDRSGEAFNYIGRIPDLISFNPDVIIVSCSVNDNNSQAQIPANVLEWHTQVRAFTNVPIIVLGQPNKQDAVFVTLEQTYKTAFDSINDSNLLFVTANLSNSNVPSYGTGIVTNKKLDGTADEQQSDATHFQIGGILFGVNGWRER